MNLDIGEMPSYSAALDGTDSDPQRPVRVLGHAVARIADRFPIARKISRHMEGNETRAGLGSDLIAEAVELYARNTEAIDSLFSQYIAAVKQSGMQRRAQKVSKKNAQKNGAEGPAMAGQTIPIRRENATG